MAAQQWVLWGFKPEVVGVPIKIVGGSKRQCTVEQKYLEAEGWTCAVYTRGTAPVGLRSLAALVARG